MVTATRRALSQQRRDERANVENIELLRNATQRDWLSQPITIAVISDIEKAIEQANDNAVTTREVKFLDRAHGLRDALAIIIKQKQ